MDCRRRKAARLLVSVLIGAALYASVLAGHAAAAPVPAEGTEFFEKNIRPVLVECCYSCHSAQAKKLKGGLRLDSPEGLRRGGDGGPIVVPGQPDKSRLIQAIRYTNPDLQMPPKQPLSKQEVAHFEAWVKMGAPDPRKESAQAPAVPAAIDLQQGRRFWSFQPVRDPPVPAVKNKTWPLNAVDHFLLAAMESRGLTPVPPADRRTLIRRVTFDLTGLPPSPDEVEAFVNDPSPRAYEKVVDRLLASPHYGEQWGRHWLDIVRYADTSGCNSDFPVPSAYKYRNYVIDSFNRDKPYDQFLHEQLAGDLLPHQDDAERREHIIATGYLAISRRFGSNAEEFHLTLEDTIDNVGKALLGLSVSCARCHDHKFDPIPQRDYYALYGIFASSTYAFPGTETLRHSKDFVALGTPEEAARLRKYETELTDIDRKVAKLLAEEALLKLTAKDPKKAPPGRRTLVEVQAELGQALQRERNLEFAPRPVDKAYAVTEGTPADAKIQIKGDPKHQGESVPRGFLQILGGQRLPPDAKGSGRKELAEWITDPKNPLTARVMVNRIWQYHFGKGIVQTPNDFGSRGKRPTHPELLDYLAARFVQSGWSIKAMHKLMLLSQTYQLASTDDPRNAALDANNDLLWKFNRRRLAAEEIRDAMLAVSGTLDPTVGGPHPFPPEKEWRYTQHTPFVAVYDSKRRSVYLMQQRIRKHPFLELFDGADTNATTAERPVSTTALQALFMMNSAFVHEQADQFAVRAGLAFAEEDGRIDYMYRLAFSRPASAEELEVGRDYLRTCRRKMKDAGLPWDRQARAALASYARVLLSNNEFLFVD